MGRVWRRDGLDSEQSSASGPVPLVMRLPNAVEASHRCEMIASIVKHRALVWGSLSV
jgi:hypothetical protein